ncbi:MAG: calcium-binding protein [Deltaproteobacteria bacterium]
MDQDSTVCAPHPSVPTLYKGKSKNMKNTWGKTSLSCSGLILAALLPGLACQDEQVQLPGTDNEFGVLLEGLGDNITDCTAAGATQLPVVPGTPATLTMSIQGFDAVVSVVGGKLKVNGRQCMNSVTGAEITTAAVPRLVINGPSNPGASKLVLDLLPGDFGGLFGTTGGITVNVGTGALAVGVRGTDGVNNFKMAQDSVLPYPLFLELNANTAADVKITGTPSSMVFTLGGGADIFNAQDTTTLTFQGTAQTTLAAVKAAQSLTVYGGTGADVLEGGKGDDTLYGGDDNDTFQTLAAGGDGADTFYGGNGIDTVDYSNRTAAVTVDVDPVIATAYVEGMNLRGVVLTGKTLAITMAPAAIVNYTAGPVQGIAAFVGNLQTALGGTATVTADDHGQLVITRTTAGTILVGLNTLGIPQGTVSAARPDNDDGDPLANSGAGEGDNVKSDVENIKGSAFNDVLTGGILANVIDGNDGDDSISGGPAGTCTGPSPDVDTLNGGNGNDVFPMGTVNNCGDVIDGGAGTDIANYERRAGVLTISVDGAANDGETSETDNIKTTVEVVLGGTAADAITGGAGNDELHGGPGADVIKGGAGNDTLVGNDGIDTLSGEAGDDFIDEATNKDTRFEDVGASSPSAWGLADIIHGGVGANTCDFHRGGVPPVTTTNYTLCFSATTAGCTPATADGVELVDITNCNHIILDDGDDLVTGSLGDDIIEGGAGDDDISGSAGNDTLYGEAGNDTLKGDGGSDMLDGGGAGGNPQLVPLDGGAGDDDICLKPGAGTPLNCEG